MSESIDIMDHHDSDIVSSQVILTGLVAGLGIISLLNGEIPDGLLLLTSSALLMCHINNDSDDPGEPENPDFKERIVDLAEQLCTLPPPDLHDYNVEDYADLNDPDCRKMLFEYLNKSLSGTSWLLSKNLLRKVDPRLKLSIVNKDQIQTKRSDVYRIPIIVSDNAWIGEPTINTLIQGVDFYSQEITEFQLI